MNKYETLDELIVESIRNNEPGGPCHGKGVLNEAARLEKSTGRDGFRIVDGRIQALRRAGKICFATKEKAANSGGTLKPGWNVTGEQA